MRFSAGETGFSYRNGVVQKPTRSVIPRMCPLWSRLTVVISRRFSSPAIVLAVLCSLIPAAQTPTATAAPVDHQGTTASAAIAAPGAPMRLRPFDAAAPFGQGNATFKEVTGLDVHPNMLARVCTQGPVGTVTLPNGAKQRIMLSAGHCLAAEDVTGMLMGRTVDAPVRGGYKNIGTIDLVRTNGLPSGYDQLGTSAQKALRAEDWGVVVLDDGVATDGAASSRDQFNRGPSAPVPMTGVRTYRTLAPGEIALDNFAQPVCKDGSMKGRNCGVQLFYTANNVWTLNLSYATGDSGGVNFDPKTGQIIGVTSLGFGPLGTAQRADRAIESAYDLPAGTVNEHFTPAAPNGNRADFVSAKEEEAEFNQYLTEHNPGVTPEMIAPPTPRQQFDQAVAHATADAGVIANDVRDFAVLSSVAAVAGVPLGQIADAGNTVANAVGTYANAHITNVVNAGVYAALDELGY